MTWTWRCAALFAGLSLSACQCGDTTPTTPDAGDAGRTDEVRLATSPLCLTPEVVSAPTKVLVLVDRSGSTCLTDPGVAPDGGFCAGLSGPGGTSRRLASLENLIDRAANNPDVLLSFVLFGASTSRVPAGGVGSSVFVRPDSALKAQLRASFDDPPSGPTDLESALSWAHALVASDVNFLRQVDPRVLADTTYRVVLMADGPPAPRCASDDARDAGGSPSNVEGYWPDSTTACNDPGGYDGGDYNQTAALLAYVDQLRSVAAGAREVRLDTVFLFNDANIATCGPICQDLLGSYPGVPANGQYEAAKQDARAVLDLVAAHGGGVRRDLDTTSTDDPLADVAFADGGVTSAQVLFAVPWRSLPGAAAPLPDSDGDGLPDAREAELSTNALVADTDGDCFSDGFEAARTSDGFNPLTRDARGCDPASPMTPGCVCRDIDGDGLSQFEENVLGTFPSSPDTDFDGVLDGLEVRAGMDPKAKQPGRDGDGDGLSDVAELLATSNPASGLDAVFRQRYAVTPHLSVESQQGSQTCWNISVDGLATVTLKTDAGDAPGYNLVRLVLGEGVAPDNIQKWRGTCAWVKREAGSTTVPTVTFSSNQWRDLGQVTEASCEGMGPP